MHKQIGSVLLLRMSHWAGLGQHSLWQRGGGELLWSCYWCKMDAEQQKLMAGLDLVHTWRYLQAALICSIKCQKSLIQDPGSGFEKVCGHTCGSCLVGFSSSSQRAADLPGQTLPGIPLGLLSLLEVLWGRFCTGNFCSAFPCLSQVSMLLNSQLRGYTSVLSVQTFHCIEIPLICSFCISCLWSEKLIICSLPYITSGEPVTAAWLWLGFKQVKSTLWRERGGSLLVQFWQISSAGSLLSSAEQLGIAGY